MAKLHNLLVTTDLLDPLSTRRLSRYATVFKASKLREDKITRLLSSIDCLMIFSWPSFLTREKVRTMDRLRFVQSILAGVNHIPFELLDPRIVVASNAGAYSDEVAEHAWGLLLAAAKRIAEQHVQIRGGRGALVRHGGVASGVYILRNKTLGILGLGGIGTAVARIARGFGMNVIAFSRNKKSAERVHVLTGNRGLSEVLRKSDAVVLALPLTRITTRIIDTRALSKMKKEGVLVNVGRGELVDEKDLFEHLTANPSFRYATDVWWYRDGRESLVTQYPFGSLPNFVGTPHVSGPSSLVGGRPVVLAVENTLRYLRGFRPRNVVDRSDYTGK